MAVLIVRDAFFGVEGLGANVLSKNFNSNSTELDLINDNWKDGFVNNKLQKKVDEEKCLRLGLEDFTADEIKFLASKLSKMELDYLDLTFNKFCTEDIYNLLSGLSHSKIQTIYLDDNAFCDNGENVTVNMEGFQSMKLSLRSLKIGEDGGKLTLNLKDSILKTLDLSRNKLGLNGSILKLNLIGSQLEELDLSFNPLSDEIIQELLLSLKNSQVKKLICTNTKLSKEGLVALLSGLKYTSVREVIFNENHIEYSQPISNNDSISIDTSDSKIEYLNLKYYFASEDLGTVFFNFERSPLKHLVIDNSQLNLKSWDELGKALRRSTVTHLETHIGNESPEQMEAIGNCLGGTQVKKLEIITYEMEPSNLKTLLEKIKNTSVTELDFYIDNADEVTIKAMISNLGNITTLNLKSPYLSKEALETILKNLKDTKVTTIKFGVGGQALEKTPKNHLDKYLEDSKVVSVIQEEPFGDDNPKLFWQRNGKLTESININNLQSKENQPSYKTSVHENMPPRKISEQLIQDDRLEKSEKILKQYIEEGLKENSEVMERTLKELQEYYQFIENIFKDDSEESDQFRALRESHEVTGMFVRKLFDKSQEILEKSLEKGLKKSHEVSKEYSGHVNLKKNSPIQDNSNQGSVNEKGLIKESQQNSLYFFNVVPQKKENEVALSAEVKSVYN